MGRSSCLAQLAIPDWLLIAKQFVDALNILWNVVAVVLVQFVVRHSCYSLPPGLATRSCIMAGVAALLKLLDGLIVDTLLRPEKLDYAVLPKHTPLHQIRERLRTGSPSPQSGSSLGSPVSRVGSREMSRCLRMDG